MKLLIPGAACALLVAACGQQSPTPAAAAKLAPPAPAASLSGVDLSAFDAKVRPQDDLFRHVNGTWLARTAIPADKSNYGAFGKLDDEAQVHLRAIIEEAQAKPDKAPGSDEQKLGDLYASFMDEARAAEAGVKPLAAEYARIDALKSPADFAPLFAHFQQIGVPHPIFALVEQDAKVATQYVVYVGQAMPYSGTMSGLGLPDRDYYLSDDAKFKALRAKYVAHVERMLALAGHADAAPAAARILALETRIAKLHWTRVEDRDADKTYNKHERADLGKLMPAFEWATYLDALGTQKSPGIIVRQPSYLQGLNALLTEVPLGEWQPYFKWHLTRAYAPYLAPAFVDADFDFYGRTLRGIEANQPRWKRGVDMVEDSIGELAGKIYVQRHFPPASRARMEQLVDNLELAYRDSIQSLDWMSAPTKAMALEKLGKFNTKIGYPSKWKDYSAVTIERTDLVGNVMRARTAALARLTARLPGPIDREDWGMTPQTVNAYYDAGLNEIVFPAAILQPPFFNPNADDAVNYGAIGAVIGHEIGHGFDDQGSKYDGDGNLKSWWTEDDRKRFDERTRQLVAQYNAFCPLPNECVNGALTIGENIGDLGGLSIAYKAWQLSLKGQEAPVIDGLSGSQRFFIGWAQAWQRKYREEELRNRLKTDAHSPAEYRCNGIVANLPDFHAAFGVKEGDKLFLKPEQRVRIW